VLRATVQGTREYDVTVTDDDGLTVSCTCEYAAELIVCKHSWAVLLEADAQGVLPGYPGERNGNGTAARRSRRGSGSSAPCSGR
jgi:uncharacterized Zn finger protein